MHLCDAQTITASEHPKVYPERVAYLITCFPTRFLSRLWGIVNEFELPKWLRKPVLGAYAWIFDCNLDEVLFRGQRSDYPRQLMEILSTTVTCKSSSRATCGSGFVPSLTTWS
jgi:hypothetical protein